MVKISKMTIFSWLKLSGSLFHTLNITFTSFRDLASSIRLMFTTKTCFSLSRFSISNSKTTNYEGKESLIYTLVASCNGKVLVWNDGKINLLSFRCEWRCQEHQRGFMFLKILKSFSKRVCHRPNGKFKTLWIDYTTSYFWVFLRGQKSCSRYVLHAVAVFVVRKKKRFLVAFLEALYLDGLGIKWNLRKNKVDFIA